jgi:hypothetical protein
MTDTSKILEIIDNGNSQDVVDLIQPVIQEAVKLGILPKAAPTDIYEKNWSGFTKLMRTFIVNAEEKLG